LVAKKQADSIVETARHQAHEEGVRIIEQAHAEIDHLAELAKEALRKQVATLAINGAERILEHSVDPKIHQEMLEKLAQEI
jgi:F-type H+-transporting ATPase subunit b